MYTKILKEIFPKLSKNIQEILIKNIDEKIWNNVVEIRIRMGKNLILKLYDGDIIVNYVISGQDVDEILERISNHSFYTIQEDLNQGYITIEGGHRIGIAGTCILRNNIIENVKNISSLNIRIAREIIGCAKEIYNQIYINGFESTLIISEPNVGKTTNIRDITRMLSNNKYTISVIDERSEIACMYNGIPQLDIGNRTDVINKCKKCIGIRMAIRSLAPDIVVVDEIGSNEDIFEIKNGILSGVKFLVTAHGNSLDEIKNSNINELIQLNVFKYLVILKKNFKKEIIQLY